MRNVAFVFALCISVQMVAQQVPTQSCGPDKDLANSTPLNLEYGQQCPIECNANIDLNNTDDDQPGNGVDWLSASWQVAVSCMSGNPNQSCTSFTYTRILPNAQCGVCPSCSANCVQNTCSSIGQYCDSISDISPTPCVDCSSGCNYDPACTNYQGDCVCFGMCGGGGGAGDTNNLGYDDSGGCDYSTDPCCVLTS